MAFNDLAPGEGLEPSLSDFKDRRVASYTIPEESRANDRTRTCIDESHNLAPHPFGHVRHQMAGMERLELSRSGLKNLLLARFAFIPTSNIDAGEGNRTPKTLGLSERCLPVASLPQDFLLHGSRFTNHDLVAESGVSPDGLPIMSRPSLIPAPPPHQRARGESRTHDDRFCRPAP